MKILIVVQLILAISCFETKKNDSKPNDIADKLCIVNYTSFMKSFDKICVSDSASVNKLLNETKNFLLYPQSSFSINPPTKISLGSLEVIFSIESQEIRKVQIFYTLYDGVVLVNENQEYYKNNDFSFMTMKIVQDFLDKRSLSGNRPQ